MSIKAAGKKCLLLKDWYILLEKFARQSSVHLPFLKAYRLSERIELCSSHQSRRFFRINSMVLHSAEDRAMGLNAVVELALGIGMTMNSFQESGILLRRRILLSIFKRYSTALVGRCLSITGEMLSGPEAIDLREAMAAFSSLKVIGMEIMWLVSEFGAGEIELCKASEDEGT